MVGANELNAAIENYLDKVDDYIVAHSMDDKRGTEVLDPIQEEVDATLDRVRSVGSSSNITSIRVELNRSLERTESAHVRLVDSLSAPVHFLAPALPVEEALGRNAPPRSLLKFRVTSRFSNLLVNLDSNRRNQFDTNFARIIDYCNAQMQRSDGDEGAESCCKWALAEIAKIEQQMSTLQQQSAAEMMSVLIQEKDAERLSLISQGKSVEKGMSDANRKVINMHNEKAMAILAEMAGNKTTFDGAVRDAKFRLVDKHLANIQRIVQMHAFASDMAGGMFTSQKNLGSVHRRAAASHKANFTHSRIYKQRLSFDPRRSFGCARFC